MIGLSIAKYDEGGTKITPGHGRISEIGGVQEYRNNLVAIRDRLKAMLARNMSVEQIRAAGATIEFDRRYGNESAPANIERLVEAAGEYLLTQ